MRNQIYSGYKKRTTLKYNVVCTLEKHLVVHIDGPHDDPIHDRVAFENSGYLDEMDDEEVVIADQKYHLEDEGRIVTVHDIGFQDQQEFTDRRSHVEHLFATLKVFGILSGTFRHELGKHDMVFRLICKVNNLRVFNNL